MQGTVSSFVGICASTGTHALFLACNMKEADTKGLMGFAIHWAHANSC